MGAATESVARVFFALVPPASLRQALASLGVGIARRAQGRPVPAENLHVTVAFVGEWPRSGMSHWIDAGAKCAAPPMRMTLDMLGGFRRAGVAWLGASVPPRPLLELAAGLNAELANAGIADARQFHPHLTLARRCRGPAPRDTVGPYEWDVDALTLMESRAEAGGPRYVELERWRLLANADGP